MFIFTSGKSLVWGNNAMPVMSKLETNWTACDESSGSKFKAVVADVSDPCPLRFSFLLFGVCADYDGSSCVNPNLFG